MPPFRLEGLDKRKNEEKSEKLMYAENTYDRKVKITDWETFAEGYPIDNDPYCPGSLNYHLSHHKSFGFGQIEPYETTTQRALEQIHLKDEINPKNLNKYILNYFTYKDTLACEANPNKTPTSVCPPICTADYVTTMQHSYTPPYPFKMQRFGILKIPYLENRTFKRELPELSHYKFFDEGFKTECALLRKHKQHRWVSTIPWNGVKTDGTVPKEHNQKCFELEYLKDRV